MSPEEREDWRQYKQQASAEAHGRLCERYLPDVRRIVGRMAIYKGDAAVDGEDLVHAGVIGLIDAIEKYDERLAPRFMDFAFKRIRGAVYDELRSLDGFSSRTRRSQKTLEKVKAELQNRLFRSPTEEETAAELGVDLDQFRRLQTNVQNLRPTPLLDPEVENQGAAVFKMGHWMPAADGLSPAEKQRIIAGKIDQLPSRMKIMLGLYYRDGLTLKEIAEVLDLCESRVCQLHREAMALLQQELAKIGAIFAEP